jgi:hypothetical protein
MPRFVRLAFPTALMAVALQASVALAQAPVCEQGEAVTTEELGVANANGINRVERFTSSSEQRAFRFLVSDPGSLFVYVGDQWYDLDLAVYSIALNKSIACWTTTGAKARSERSQSRQIQLIRPDETIVQAVEPGVYVLLVGVESRLRNNDALGGFRADKDFTVRVAANPIVCGLNPPNVPNPQYPEVRQRADDAWYQLAMNFQPLLPTVNSLMTFQATASPPYNDLFDFQWSVNGRPVPGATDTVFQVPASQVASAGGRGQVSVTATGARVYPDPDQPHTPLDGGALTVECPVLVR